MLLVVLAAIRLQFPPSAEPAAITTLKRWLDTWASIGRIAIGMARQGYDLQLTRYGAEGWRATFYPEGREHSPTRAVGTGWAKTPWHAVQEAAWEALKERELIAGAPGPR